MHILFYSTASLFDGRFMLLLDEAACCEAAGDQVTFVYCDGCLRHCRCNISGSATVCRVCTYLTKKALARLSPRVAARPLSQFLTAADEEAVDAYEPAYASARELQGVLFHGVDVGYAVLSHYIGMKRNLVPTLTPDLRHLFACHLKAAARLTLASENLIGQCRADCYALFNARMFDTRGFLRTVMRTEGCQLRCYEVELDPATREKRKVFFENSSAHNIVAYARLIEEKWRADSARLPAGELAALGTSFFERRRNAQPTNDPNVYTRNQSRGKLPENWSESERNFVFFNTSEDEFASIDREFDQYKYLPVQADVIRRVSALARQADPSIRLYLRIHPNLEGVEFDYHRELQRLGHECPNLTVIPADSPISTYTLLDQAEKVLVTGSTVGIEAVYAEKPVILLGPAIYRFLEVCHIPKDDAELQALLQARLAPKDRLPALKYGYYMLSVKGQPWRYFDFSTNKKRLLGMRVPYANCYRLLGSPRLFGLAYKIVSGLLFIPYHLKRSAWRRLGMADART